MDAHTPTSLAKTARISKSYACEILKGTRKTVSPRTAIQIYRLAGLKLPQLESLSDVEIDAYEAILGKIAA